MVRYLSALILFAALPIQAAIYYVDYQTGNDGNAGTLTTIPWKHCVGDTNATGIPAVLTLAAGDTVNFKGGTYYYGTGRIIQISSGVTYDGLSWGPGKCTITSSNASATGFYGSLKDNVLITGFTLTDIGGFAESNPIINSGTDITAAMVPAGTGILLNGCTGTTVTNCNFSEIGHWINCTNNFDGNSIQGICVNVVGSSNTVVTGCDFTRARVGTRLRPAAGLMDNVTVRNCTFHNYMVWLVDIGPNVSGDRCQNTLIDRCSFYDYHEYTTGSWVGQGDRPHTDGIFIRTSSTQNTIWTNVTVNACSFWCDNPVGTGGTASIYISQGPSANVYNCLFRRQQMGDSVLVDFPNPSNVNQPKQIVRVYNNSFTDSIRQIRSEDEPNAAKREIYIANNIIYTTVAGTFSTPLSLLTLQPNGLNYDCYWHPSWPLGDRDMIVFPTSRDTVAQAQARGWETNGFYGNPLYVDATNSVPSLRNLAISAGSPCIGTGTNLSAFFTTDFNGNTRTNWDIGAISFGSSAPPTPPIPGGPGSLRITNGRITSFTSIP